MTDFSAVDQAFSTPQQTGDFSAIDQAFDKPTPFPSQNKLAPSEASPTGVLSNAPGNSDSVASSALKSAGTMGVEGFAGAAGALGSLRDLGRELGDRAVSYVTGTPLEEVQARGNKAQQQWAASPWNVVPDLQPPSAADISGKITKYTGAYEPTSELGRLAQAGGSALIGGAMMAPEAGLVNAGANLVGGVAGQATSDAGYSPLVSSLVGMGAAAGAGAGAAPLAPAISKGSRLARVGNTLLGEDSNPEEFKQTILNPPPANIPDEQLTTAQTMASAGKFDTGIGQLEREVSRAAPAAFIDKNNAAQQAQVAAKTAIQHGGSPEDVGNFVTSQSRDLDSQWDAAQQAATARAQGATAPLGGEQPLSVYGQRLANELIPEYEAARAPAVEQANDLGGTQDPSALGAQMRAPALAAQEALRQQRSSLFKAVDPDGTLNVVSTPLRQAHDDIYGNMSPLAAPPTGEEAAIKGVMQGAPDVLPFRDLQALDSRVTAAMSAERAANGESPAWGRLAQQKNAILNTINDGVANQVALERGQVASGAMAPQDTVEARAAQWRDNFYANKNAQASGLETSSGNAGSGSVAVPSVSGAKGQRNLRSPNTGGNQGIPQGTSSANFNPSTWGKYASDNWGAPVQSLAPNFDPDAIARLAAAKAAHIDLAQMKASPVGAITKSSGFGGQFKMSDASVPSAMIQKGDKGFQVASAFRKYAGDDPSTISTIRNYLGYKLRQGYLNADGTVNAAKYPGFRKDYDGVFRAFPELAPEFDRAASATDALKKFGKFHPQYAPTNVPDLFFAPGAAGSAGVQHLRALIGKDKADPVLEDVATNLMRAHAERNGVITPAGLEAFDRKYGPAMSQFPSLRQKFQDAGKATQQIAETAAARKQAVEDFQKGAVGRLIGVNDPTTVQRIVGSIFSRADAVPVMGRLAALAAKDPSGVAMEGLRQAVADHITQQFSNAQGKITPGSLQKFMRKQDPVLRQVFSPEQMNQWAPLIKSIESTNASNVENKIGVGSDTAQNMIKHLKAMGEKGPKERLFESMWKSALVSREVFEPLLHHVGLGSVAMPLAMTASVGNKVLSAMRDAGINKTSDLLKEALLNPGVAKAALMAASKKANQGSELALATQLRRLSMLGPQTYAAQGNATAH